MYPEETETDTKNLSTRVNAARLPEYIGRHVRLTCKVLKVSASPPYPVFETYYCRTPVKLNEDRATVEASDGGQVNVQLSAATLSQVGC